jgi:monoamine oxidase
MAEHDRECEVVVVGAGYSGLAAARHLARAGVDVLVVDARHRVGGRSYTQVTRTGYTIDQGGQWIGPTQDHLAALDVPLHAPWNAAHAAALDAQTLATYFGTYLKSASARAILEVAVKAIFGTGSGELSLLFTLFYLHAGGAGHEGTFLQDARQLRL